jgi:uncharacterized Zn finger protein (UPF0148 family)
MRVKELDCPKCGAPLTDFAPNKQIECGNCGAVFIAEDITAPSTVLCQNCQTINPINERYCTSCGESLKIDCILCHTENSIETVFCANCGAHLKNALSQREKRRTDRQKLRAEQQRLYEEKEARQRVEKLQRLLDDLDEPENHDFAIYQINQMGEMAIEALVETVLEDDDPDARYGSARAMGQICQEHQIKPLIKARASRALVQALGDHEPAVRYWSADALGKCGSQVAVEPLASLLKDKHQGVRKQARRSLCQIGGERVAQILNQPHQKSEKSVQQKGLIDWIKGT